MENLKRPTREETDEDLIQQQELFLKNKSKPIVNVARKYKQESFQQKQSAQDPVTTEEDNLVIQEKDVVFDVMERDISLLKPFTFETPVDPSISVDDLMNKKFKGKKSQSVFAQLLEKKKEEHKKNEALNESSSILLDGSGLLSDRPELEIENIHKENLAKISSMSQEEILYHQNQLKKHLDPNIIKFIQNKRNYQKTASSAEIRNKKAVTSPLTNLTTNNDFEDGDQSSGEVLRKEGKSECDALILERAMEFEANYNQKELHAPVVEAKHKDLEIPVEAKKLVEGSIKGLWKNMNKIEKEKLEWMSDLPKPNPVDLKTGFTARFDFEGKLLARDLETPTYKGLHHHGSEPEVAGYSLEELFLLARSTMQSQRITALHTIAHILDNYWYGMMDGCFDNPLLPSILEAGIVPLLRWALDDTSITSIAATITAIHSLLICKSDELCLQRSFCWLNGHLMPQLESQDLMESNVVIEELTDADLIKLDVIKKCVFEFFHYFPLSVHDCSKLTDTVNFSYPMPSAMKLMRIIVSSSQELAVHLIENHDLISNIILYLTLQPNDGKVTLQDIQEIMIESLKTFHILLSYGLAYDIFLELFPIFLKQMEFCLSLDLNFERSSHMRDFEYASHLFKVLEAVAIASSKYESDSSYAAMNAIFNKSLVCLKKWLWQFPQDRYNDHGMLLLSTCMNFISTCYEKLHNELICKAWKPCSETKEVFNSYLLPCIKSKMFKRLLENLRSCSILLNSSQSGNKRDSKTLISLGSILWKEDVVPVLKEDSSIPLLLAVLRLCILQKQHFSDTNNQFLEELLLDKNILVYLESLASEKLNALNWFAKYEKHLIALILKLASLVTPREASFWYKTATSIIPIFRTPEEGLVEDLFESIIFNPVFIVSSDKEICKDTLCRLPVIAKSYILCLLEPDALLHSRHILSGNTDVNTVSFLCKTPFLLSFDWSYKPIAEQYYNFTKRKPISEVSLQLTSSLQWIHMCHDLQLPLVKDIPGAVDFMYFCMVFLLDEDFFRDSNVQNLLKDSLISLLKYKSISLEKVDWPNMKSFDDLYLEMLNQYEAVSYGDQLFGNFVLFPLQQSYPSRWKRLLLTDHCQVVQFLRMPISKLLIPLQKFLEPNETEVDIILEYSKVLLSGTLNPTRCPVLYLMAVHHINHFLFARENEVAKSQKKLLLIILQSKNKKIQHQILLYSGANTSFECGFSVKENLSHEDQEHFSGIIGHPVNI
ncbi:RNA polymerase II-associated protein 1 like protein [Argiope bruennichi]|uniref:RNA polymerase II-associated protein 1 like protein n=1 Tax=Argiope bruennichi TaxID=94029 RepID=A0A8T0G0Q0_ARGBR|nr:RNA polymerase II-associated protein 1 like protein [Argiope bruennichi]